MGAFPSFVGSSNVTRSRNQDAEETINYYVELINDGSPKVRSALYGVPGYRPFAHLTAGPVRGLFAQDGRAWAVGGGVVFELFAGGTVTTVGTVAVNGQPADLACNGAAGHQLAIVSGGLIYILDLISGAFTLAGGTGVPSPALRLAFCDGYFIALKGQSNEFQISNLEDGLIWDALDKGQVSESSNQLLSLVVDHRELWLLGSKTTEVWFNSGNAGFPFQPQQSAFIESGIFAPFSAAKIDNSFLWIQGDARGAGCVVKANGYTPQIVSNRAVESQIQQLARYDNALAWTYQMGGHSFYLLYLPNSDTTWCFDLSNNTWTKRGLWDTRLERYTPDIGRCHCFAFGKHLVGSRTTGTIYEMNSDFYDYELVVP